MLHLWWFCGSGLNYERNWNHQLPCDDEHLLCFFLYCWWQGCCRVFWTYKLLCFKILSTVSKSFSASDSLKNEPGKQLLMIIVSEYAGKLPIRLIPLWLNMPKEIKRAEWRNKRECWSICHLICTYAIAGCHSTKMLIRFAASLLRIKIFFITFYDAEVFFMWIILFFLSEYVLENIFKRVTLAVDFTISIYERRINWLDFDSVFGFAFRPNEKCNKLNCYSCIRISVLLQYNKYS